MGDLAATPWYGADVARACRGRTLKDSQTDIFRQADKETDKEIDKETDKETDIDRDIQRQTEIGRERQR